MLNFLLDTFVPVRRINVTEGDRLCSVRNWFDESVELVVNERDSAYKVWYDNIDREWGNRLWILYVQKRRYADGLVRGGLGPKSVRANMFFKSHKDMEPLFH
jgi:hypothetical protein